VRTAARRRGQAIAAEAPKALTRPRSASGELDRIGATLARSGYDPSRRGSDLVLANCPFDALAKQHTDLVCGLNLDLVGGVIDGLSCHRVEARLDPEAGLCCVKVGARH
jgi:predicted ArsR family transcriptional regulator